MFHGAVPGLAAASLRGAPVKVMPKILATHITASAPAIANATIASGARRRRAPAPFWLRLNRDW